MFQDYTKAYADFEKWFGKLKLKKAKDAPYSRHLGQMAEKTGVYFNYSVLHHTPNPIYLDYIGCVGEYYFMYWWEIIHFINSVPEKGVGLSAYCIPKNGRAHTKTFLDSFWIPSPNNPGRTARWYGRENLKHVSWHPGRKIAYDHLIPGFGR